MKTLIGIPTLNNAERLKRCLASIQNYTVLDDPSNPVEVLVSDDFSKPESTEHNKQVCASFEVNMLMAPQRYGIATQWNRLTRHAPDADVIVLVNDDIQVAPNWLDVLRYSVMNNDHAGMVSLPSQQIESEIIYDEWGRFADTDYEEATLRDGNGELVSSGGACFAFRRGLFEEVGGFDERFLCYYEEVDFGVRLALRGYFHFIADWPVLGHEIGATIASNYDARALLAESLQKFTDKWIGKWEWAPEAYGESRLGFTSPIPDLYLVRKFPSLDALREQLGHRELPKTKHWNSQWQNWRKP